MSFNSVIEVFVPENKEAAAEGYFQNALGFEIGIDPATGVRGEVDFFRQPWAPNADDPMPTHWSTGSLEISDKSVALTVQSDLEGWWAGAFANEFTAAGTRVRDKGSDTPVAWTMERQTNPSAPQLNDPATWWTRQQYRTRQAEILGNLVKWEPSPGVGSASAERKVNVFSLHESIPNPKVGKPRMPSAWMRTLEDWRSGIQFRYWPASSTGGLPVQQYMLGIRANLSSVVRAIKRRSDIPNDRNILITTAPDNVLRWLSNTGPVNNGVFEPADILENYSLQPIGQPNGYTIDELNDLLN